MLGISSDTWILIGGPGVAVATLIYVIVNTRRKPMVDTATATREIASSEEIRTTIRETAERLNIRRDLRILDLEQWADKIRPYLRLITTRFEQLCDIIAEDRAVLKLPMPDIEPLPPAPELPPPRLT